MSNRFVALVSLAHERGWCVRVFCTTCGAGDFRRALQRVGAAALRQALTDLTPEHLMRLSDWDEALQIALFDLSETTDVTPVLEAWLARVGDRPRFDDVVLFRIVRAMRADSNLRARWIEATMAVALRRQDVSLIESLLLVLRGAARDYPALVAAGLELSRGSAQMRRVLRNCLAPSGLLPCAPEVSSHGSSEEGAGPSSVRAEWPASIPFMPPRPASTGTGRDQPNPGAVCPFCRHLTADTVQCDRCGGAVLMSYVAVHEAAHAVITYRAAGYVGGNTSIVPNSTGLGRVHDSVLDVRNPFHVRGSILSVYAGGHAARELDPVFGQEGCGTDERIALAMLRFAGWVNLELSFRQRSLDLVRLHMTEIVAVARELLKVRELTADQVIAIADRAAGVAPFGEYVVFTRDRAIGALFSWLLRAAQRTPRVWKTLAQLVRAVPNEQGTWAPILSDPRRWPSSHSEPSRPES